MPARESLILDGVELNDLTGSYVLRSIDFPVPKKRYEWVTGADSDGAELVRDPLFENRTIPMSLRVAQQSTMDAALALIAQLVGKIEEAELQTDGLDLVWTPANSTKSITFKVLSGEIDGVPVTREGPDRGWLRNYPIVNVTLTCKPFGYGAFVSAAASASGATPLVTVEIPSVAGDVPAEGTIVVTDLATKSRRDALWGLEQRYYTPGGGAAPLTIAAGSLVTSGFAGAAGTLTGAYLSNVISANVAEQPTAVCGTGNQPHIGTYRVRARVQAATVAARFRLAWQDGDGPFSANPWIAPPAGGGWCEIDLGPITIEPSALGTQRWTGRVEAYTTDGAAQTVYVNLLELIPAGEGYGRARAAYAYKPGVVVARDDFTGLAAAANLNGRVAPVGGTWVTAGDTTDYQGVDILTSDILYPALGAKAVKRNTGTEFTGRYGVLGGAMTDTEVGTVVAPGIPFGGPPNNASMGVAARYVDTSNAVRAYFNHSTGVFTVNIILAGSQTAFNAASMAAGHVVTTWSIRLIVFASGAVTGTLLDANGAILREVTIAAGVRSELAAGGALASGKPALFDQALGSSALNRIYGKYYASIPPVEPIVVNSGQSIEFRHNDVQRRDASGTYGGRPPAYRGGRVMVPPAGAVGRTSRVVVAARRGDTDTGVDGGVTDNTQVVVQLTPRYLVVPH